MKSVNILANIALLAASVLTSGIASAKLPQLHVYRNDGTKFHKIEGDVSASHHYKGDECVLTLSGQGKTCDIPVENIERIATSFTDVPTLIINTPDDPDLFQIKEKENYVKAKIAIDGNGIIEDAEAIDVQIKGRGNSTWTMPKKPMRLKFAKKTAFAGFKKAKNFVLLANFVDPSLMRNAVAMKIAQLLEIPYANHIMPCNVKFNGHDLGCFMLTEKIGINSSSVDIDELKGMLFEMSEEFDEPYKFKSDNYDLPVMVKDPDLDEISADNPQLGSPNEILEKWQADYNRAEALVEQNRGFEAFDLNSFVDYFLLYNICGNNEVGFPKSLYIHKEEIGEHSLYKFGPVWDFDVAFNIKKYDESGVPHQIFSEGNIWMNKLMKKLYKTPGFMERYKERLNYFYTDLYPELLEYFDRYAASIKAAAKVNGTLWPEDPGLRMPCNSFNHEDEARELRKWLQERIDHLIGMER